jgi:hypothetical protein
MSLPKISTFDFNALSYSAELKTTKAGGKCVQVGYGAGKEQVKFQLGDSVHDALLCKWGADKCDPNDPDSELQIKLELTDKSKAFVEKLEAATAAAAEANSMAWFKKKKPTAMLSSAIKPDKEDKYPDMVKLKLDTKSDNPARRTSVKVAMWKDGKLTTPTPGTIEDITPGSMVLPIVRVQGGVWFMGAGYGTKLVAESVLVIKDEEASHGANAEFDLGDDVEMVEHAEDDAFSDE